jgi:hypothetical protein
VLYEILSPHVEETVVAGIREGRGQKSDVLDAFRRAEELRTGTIKTQVLKAPRLYARLRELSRVHTMWFVNEFGAFSAAAVLVAVFYWMKRRELSRPDEVPDGVTGAAPPTR